MWLLRFIAGVAMTTAMSGVAAAGADFELFDDFASGR